MILVLCFDAYYPLFLGKILKNLGIRTDPLVEVEECILFRLQLELILVLFLKTDFHRLFWEVSLCILFHLNCPCSQILLHIPCAS